jgi:hypothetical protein
LQAKDILKMVHRNHQVQLRQSAVLKRQHRRRVQVLEAVKASAKRQRQLNNVSRSSTPKGIWEWVAECEDEALLCFLE